jgi:hypothetical protein
VVREGVGFGSAAGDAARFIETTEKRRIVSVSEKFEENLSATMFGVSRFRRCS